MRALVLLAGATLAISAIPAANAAWADAPVVPVANAWTASQEPGAGDGVIVHWNTGTSRAARASARADVNAVDVTNLGNPAFQLLNLADGQDAADAVRTLRSNPAVATVSRDGVSILHAPAPNDPLFSQLWGLDNKGLNVGGVSPSTAGDDISALDAWSKTTGDDSVVVADLDTGIRPDHPDLKNRVWKNTGETPGDGIDNDANGYVDDTFGMDFAGANIDLDPLVFDNDPTDDIAEGGHGIHTAGTIAAEGNNGIGITGVAQKARIMALRVCGWSPTYSGVYCMHSSQIAAINYAGANGAKIANMSLGGTSQNPLVRDAFAANPNVLFVVSAGNSGKDVEVPAQTTYPCSFDPTTSSVPGAVDNVVCVAASDQNDAIASFSNWGKTKVDIAAPGTETLSTWNTLDVSKEDFAASGFPYAGWTAGGWTRVNTAPLTSFGITNDTATQGASSTRSVTTASTAVTGPTTCTLSFLRKLTSTGDTFTYGGVVNGTAQPTVTGANQALGTYSTSFDVPAGQQNVAARFTYARGAATSASNGVWIDNVGLSCYVAPGQEGPTGGYTFLQGTSMAAPHVSGAAALLAAYEPEATTMQLRQALLSSVDPVADFNPATGGHPITTGGRLNADKALAAVDALVAPDTTITSAPSTSTTGTSATFTFASSAKNPVVFECRVDGGAFSACTSPLTLTGLAVGVHTFQVRARDTSTSANADATPATRIWEVQAPATPPVTPPATPPVTPPVVQPDPPVEVKPALAAPAKVSGITVKRAKKAATLTWPAVAGATSYRVQVGTTAKTTSTPRVKIAKLRATKRYTVTITAVNSAGSSPVSRVRVGTFKR